MTTADASTDEAAAPVGLRAALGPVTALLIGTFLLYAGYGLQATLVPLRADLEGFGRFAIGLIGSAYYVGFVLGCLFVPHLILRAGHIRAFATLMACVSAGVLAFPIILGSPQWILLRVAIGVCISGLLVIVESWLNEKATNESRGTVMSTYVVITYGAIVLGQMGVTAMPLTGFALFSFCSIILSLATVPVALTRASQPAPVPVVGFRPKKLFAVAPAAFAGAFTSGVMTGSVFSLGAIFALDVGFTTDEAALFVSAIMVGGALGQYPFGRLSDFFDRRLVLLGIAAGTVAMALLTVAMSLGPKSGLLIAGGLYGFVMLPTYSLAAAHAFDWTKHEDMVETSAGLILMFGVGSVLGPIVASAIMGMTGPSGLFLTHAVAAALLAGFLGLRLFSRRRPSEAMRSDFDIFSTAPVGGALTPDPVTVDDANMEAPANYTPPDDAEADVDELPLAASDDALPEPVSEDHVEASEETR